jgi:hypothetical protein
MRCVLPLALCLAVATLGVLGERAPRRERAPRAPRASLCATRGCMPPRGGERAKRGLSLAAR